MIQDSSTVEYEFLDKPVHYSPEFLSSLTGNVSCDVCDEHNGVKLTKTKNIFLKEIRKFFPKMPQKGGRKTRGARSFQKKTAKRNIHFYCHFCVN